MKLRVAIWCLCAMVGFAVQAVQAQKRIIAFYNVENLFDTINDPTADDGDFTPSGINRWNTPVYCHKLGQISRVLSELGADIVGLAEVENGRALDDLTAEPKLRESGYEYIHFDSRDKRGIDVALLYRPRSFTLFGCEPLTYRNTPVEGSREILHVWGETAGQKLHILVCHMPSVLSSNRYRDAAGYSLRYYADSLALATSGAYVMAMGDFNANPDDRLMRTIASPQNGSRMEHLHGKLYRQGYGSYMYRGRWNMYDGILLHRMDTDTAPAGWEGHLFIRDYLIQPDGKYSGYPFRSFSGNRYIGGYSDHLPVYLVVDFATQGND